MVLAEGVGVAVQLGVDIAETRVQEPLLCKLQRRLEYLCCTGEHKRKDLRRAYGKIGATVGVRRCACASV